MNPETVTVDGMGWPVEEKVNAALQQAGDALARDADGARHIAEDMLGPCKHEWRQYMGAVDIPSRAVLVADTQITVPDGFFCIHCPARSDENRVITNSEAL